MMVVENQHVVVTRELFILNTYLIIIKTLHHNISMHACVFFVDIGGSLL